MATRPVEADAKNRDLPLAAGHETRRDETPDRHAVHRRNALDLELDTILVRDGAHAAVDVELERAPLKRAVEEHLARNRPYRTRGAELGREREQRAAVVEALLAVGAAVRAACRRACGRRSRGQSVVQRRAEGRDCSGDLTLTLGEAT